MYTVAHVPYAIPDAPISVFTADNDTDLIGWLIEFLGISPEDVVCIDADGAVDSDENDVELTVDDCIRYLENWFSGDGTFGSIYLTIIEGMPGSGNVIFER